MSCPTGIAEMKQKSFASVAWEMKQKKTRREIFLEDMEQVVPWTEWVKRIEPYDPKGEDGCPPTGLERMLRIYFMQLWFNQSDPEGQSMLFRDKNAHRDRLAGHRSYGGGHDHRDP